MLLALLGALGLNGCGGDADTPFTPESPGLIDPPFDREGFVSHVLPVFERRGCAAARCHGSNQIPFPLTGDPDVDFLRTADQVDRAAPATSSLLLKPLAVAAGGTLHDAPTIFHATNDPDFLILAQWAGASPGRAQR
jgi:hypothetical protein